MKMPCGMSLLAGLLGAIQLETRAALADTILADPSRMMTTAKRMDFVGRSSMSVVQTPSGPCLRSTPHQSASGLYQAVDTGAAQLKHVSWTWRVDQLQASADLRKLETEDSAATLFFIFGEPSLFNRDVPTLAYVWSGTPVADGTVFKSARFRSLHYIQLHGAKAAGTWQTDTRDIAADYRAIFHAEPGPLKFISLFNDNDQTGEPTSAMFCPVRDEQ